MHDGDITSATRNEGITNKFPITIDLH